MTDPAPPPPRQSVEDLGLEDEDQIQLYLELIRIIEKDIDEIKAGDTRSGWTSWAIVGGIVGAVLLFFGETRRIEFFPIQEVKSVGLAILLAYIIAVLSMGVFSVSLPEIRSGRLRWSNEAFFSSVPRVIFRFLFFGAAVWAALTLPLPGWLRLLVAIPFGVWMFWTIIALIYSRLKFPLGNTKSTRKGAYLTYLVTILPSFVALVFLGQQLHFPAGEAATLPYILAGLIFGVLWLVDNLISMMTPSRLLSNLQDLRNDIVFLRVDIDEALRRYEPLTEGETLPDALQKDLSEIANDINLITYAQSNMDRLLGKIFSELPLPNDATERKEQKQTQLRLFFDSYSLHGTKCTELNTILKDKLKRFNRKSGWVRAATEDVQSESNIRQMLIQRLEFIEQSDSRLKQGLEAAKYYLSNPDKIPEELRTAIEKNEKQ